MLNVHHSPFSCPSHTAFAINQSHLYWPLLRIHCSPKSIVINIVSASPFSKLRLDCSPSPLHLHLNRQRRPSMTTLLCRRIKVPNKGFGLTAKQDIVRGVLIIEEPAIMTVQTLSFHDIHKLLEDDRCKPAGTAREHYSQLSRDDKTCFDRLAHQQQGQTKAPLDLVWSRVGTNGFLDVHDGKIVIRVFIHTAGANHSCQPNAIFHFDEISRTGKLFALRAINKNEEIVIDYIPEKSFCSIPERQKELYDGWSFSCSCNACVKPRGQSQAAFNKLNDTRIRIGELLDSFSSKTRQGALAMNLAGHQDISLLEECSKFLEDIQYEDDRIADMSVIIGTTCFTGLTSTRYISISRHYMQSGNVMLGEAFALKAHLTSMECFGANSSQSAHAQNYFNNMILNPGQ